jgi:hypothetical protein
MRMSHCIFVQRHKGINPENLMAKSRRRQVVAFFFNFRRSTSNRSAGGFMRMAFIFNFRRQRVDVTVVAPRCLQTEGRDDVDTHAFDEVMGLQCVRELALQIPLPPPRPPLSLSIWECLCISVLSLPLLYLSIEEEEEPREEEDSYPRRRTLLPSSFSACPSVLKMLLLRRKRKHCGCTPWL